MKVSECGATISSNILFQATFLCQMSRQGQCHQAGNTATDRIRWQRRTSACTATVRNFGSSQRLVPCIDGVIGQMPQRRCERTCMPSQTQAKKLLSKSITLPDWASDWFDEYFQEAANGGKIPGEAQICLTPVRWIEAGILGPHLQSPSHCCKLEITQLSKMSDMFPETGLTTRFRNEVFIMDVILNRAPCGVSNHAPSGCVAHDPNKVVLPISCRPTDQDPHADWMLGP